MRPNMFYGLLQHIRFFNVRVCSYVTVYSGRGNGLRLVSHGYIDFPKGIVF